MLTRVDSISNVAVCRGGLLLTKHEYLSLKASLRVCVHLGVGVDM